MVRLRSIDVQDSFSNQHSLTGFSAVKMMKITIFALVGVAVVVLAQDPQNPTPPAVTVVKQSDEVDPTGYNFEFELSDGTSRQEQGDYKNDTEQEGLSVKGSYRYIAPNGEHISVTYIADKNGYQPKIDEGNTEKPQA